MDNKNFSYFEHPQKGYSKISSSEKFKNITQLLKESWRIYWLKFKTLLGITGLPVGFSFLFWILMGFLSSTLVKYSIWFSIIEAISYFGSLFLWFWAIPSLVYNLKENTGIRESYKRGFKILGSYIWVYFLLGIIIAGGFLLFIIPGILFSIWFSLAFFVLVFEEKRGFDVLFRSKQLVKGKFWGVLLRFLSLGLIIGIGLFLILVLAFFGIENEQIIERISELLDYVLQLLALPFFLIYGFLIYQNLREIKSEIPYAEFPKIRKIKYALFGISGILIIVGLISISFFNIFLGRDEPPIDDSDLWLPKVEIPKEENAFYYLTQASEKLYLPEKKEELFREIAEGEKWDFEFTEELIKTNREVFDYFEKALELPYFQIPELQNPEIIDPKTPLPSFTGLIEIARLNSIKANYLFTQGKEKEAFDLAIKIVKMGQMMEDSPRPNLIGYLIGGAIKETGLQRLRIMTPNLTLSSEILKDYVAELDQFKANEEGLIKAMKMEYVIFTKMKSKIDAAFIGKASKQELEKLGMEEASFGIIRAATKLNYLYKPNQTQRIFAEYYRNFIENANKDCNEMRLVEIKPLVPYPEIKMLFTENIVGKILFDIVRVSFSRLFEKKCLEDFSVIGTQSLIAIKAHQTESGKIPTYLSELVPKYFSEVPRDPFDGQSVKYSPEKKIIYSVGKDLKDSGGSEGKDWRIMEDPSFKIEF